MLNKLSSLQKLEQGFLSQFTYIDDLSVFRPFCLFDFSLTATRELKTMVEEVMVHCFSFLLIIVFIYKILFMITAVVAKTTTYVPGNPSTTCLSVYTCASVVNYFISLLSLRASWFRCQCSLVSFEWLISYNR